MSTISVTNIADGDAVTAASINNQVNTIVNDYNGNITDANVSTSAAIAGQKLAGGVSGMFGAWSSWTPTMGGAYTIGNGTITYAKYIQIGKTVHFRFKTTVGSTTAVGASITMSLPVNLHADYVAPDPINATVVYYDLSAVTSYLGGEVQTASSSTLSLRSLHTDGTRGNLEAGAGNDPIGALATGDILYVHGSYESV